MEQVYSRTQSSSITVSFEKEEEADMWISENKIMDSNYGIKGHVEYRKQDNPPDGWLVSRKFYYEERSENGKITEVERSQISDQS